MPEVQDILRKFNIAEDYYRQIGFDGTVDTIINSKPHLNHECMEGCFVSSITSSFNYINAAHFDVDDACAGIVTWTFDDCNIEGECYFVLPNVCIDGNKATIIKLKHGITINFDAEIIMHC